MDPFQAIAFDPGASTGWAHFTYASPTNWEFFSDTISHPDHHNQIRWLIQDTYRYNQDRPLDVITESFEFRQSPDSANKRRGLELISKEYIGVMKLITQDNCIPLTQQSPGIIQHYGSPATGSNFMNYEKLERLGQLHKPLEPNRHRHDALQHLIYFLVVNKKLDVIRERIKRVA